jgi:hypothetical protein
MFKDDNEEEMQGLKQGGCQSCQQVECPPPLVRVVTCRIDKDDEEEQDLTQESQQLDRRSCWDAGSAPPAGTPCHLQDRKT